MSIEKSKLYLSNGVSPRQEAQLRNIWPLSRGFLPFIYLGIPLFKGIPKRNILLPISDGIKAKISKWNGKFLSMAGRLTLIKSVIAGAFTHSFFLYKWPSNVIKDLNSCIRNFLWTGSIMERKTVTVA